MCLRRFGSLNSEPYLVCDVESENKADPRFLCRDKNFQFCEAASSVH